MKDFIVETHVACQLFYHFVTVLVSRLNSLTKAWLALTINFHIRRRLRAHLHASKSVCEISPATRRQRQCDSFYYSFNLLLLKVLTQVFIVLGAISQIIYSSIVI